MSSRRRACSLSSMLTKIAPDSASTSRAASSRGRIIATQSPTEWSSRYANALPVLYGGSM